MATPKVFANLTGAWTEVSGAAASVAGVTWQNLGPGMIHIAFTTLAPAGGPTDAYHNLNPGEAFYDKNGSAKVWARATIGGALSATAD